MTDRIRTYQRAYEGLVRRRERAVQARLDADHEEERAHSEVVDLVRDAIEELGLAEEDCARIFGRHGSGLYRTVKGL